MSFRSAVIAIALAALVLVGVALLALDDDSSQPTGKSSSQSNLAVIAEPVARGAPRAQVRGCDQRIDGYVTQPGSDDTVVGPVAFKELPGAYRWSVRHPKVPIKSVAVLRPGARVTLVVPPAQRPWLKLGYGGKSAAVTLQACRHSRSRAARRRDCGLLGGTACSTGPTLFPGGFGVDFRQAPQRGRCAELIVWVEGEKDPRRQPLFASCAGA